MSENFSKRKKLNEEQVFKIIKEWDQKSGGDVAAEFEVAPNTIRSMVYKIRKQAPDKCPIPLFLSCRKQIGFIPNRKFTLQGRKECQHPTILLIQMRSNLLEQEPCNPTN